MMNEVTISKVEYDHLKVAEMTLNMYRKVAMKCSKYSDWRHSAVVMDDEDFLELIGLFDQGTYEEIERRCEAQKKREEKEKAAAAPSIEEINPFVDLKTEIETKVRAAAAEIKEDES